jgi:hypothetical protein
MCVKNILAHICVLAPTVPLERLREKDDDEDYLKSIEKAEPEVEDLAYFIAEKLDIQLLSFDDEAKVRLCSAWMPLSSFVKIYFICYLVKKL